MVKKKAGKPIKTKKTTGKSKPIPKKKPKKKPKIKPKTKAKKTKTKPKKKYNPKINDELEILQKMFCDEYLKDFNGGRAYMYIYKVKSMNTAYVNAARMLRYANVQKYLQLKCLELTDRAEITQEELIQSMVDALRTNIRDYVEWNGKKLEIKSFDEMTYAATGLIKEIAETDKGLMKIKFYDKEKVWDLLGKYFGIYKFKLEHEVGKTLEDLLDEGRRQTCPKCGESYGTKKKEEGEEDAKEPN